ncbi:microsomal glutathione S-transferase 2-like [Ruditapes philippinarum]|uniref:microsomal glutathione S-transferase 2-like n=1 Tax=Ruditapes philippinarum TaxID=129788 RepID=UPI00295B9D94|nr:microsomal glutathione S-transferase 2-like [Ruditapes philippinarum]
MPGITVADQILTGVVACWHAKQLGGAAAKIGDLRRKHEIAPPRTDGPDEFIRALRAQQNCLEFGVTFEIVLWLAGIFGHQVPAAVLGAIFVYSREQYFNGYIQDAEKRIKPFWMGIRALKGLFAVAILGLVNTALVHYAGINVPNMIKDKLF